MAHVVRTHARCDFYGFNYVRVRIMTQNMVCPGEHATRAWEQCLSRCRRGQRSVNVHPIKLIDSPVRISRACADFRLCDRSVTDSSRRVCFLSWRYSLFALFFTAFRGGVDTLAMFSCEINWSPCHPGCPSPPLVSVRAPKSASPGTASVPLPFSLPESSCSKRVSCRQHRRVSGCPLCSGDLCLVTGVETVRRWLHLCLDE